MSESRFSELGQTSQPWLQCTKMAVGLLEPAMTGREAIGGVKGGLLMPCSSSK